MIPFHLVKQDSCHMEDTGGKGLNYLHRVYSTCTHTQHADAQDMLYLLSVSLKLVPLLNQIVGFVIYTLERKIEHLIH